MSEHILLTASHVYLYNADALRIEEERRTNWPSVSSSEDEATHDTHFGTYLGEETTMKEHSISAALTEREHSFHSPRVVRKGKTGGTALTFYLLLAGCF